MRPLRWHSAAPDALGSGMKTQGRRLATKSTLSSLLPQSKPASYLAALCAARACQRALWSLYSLVKFFSVFSFLKQSNTLLSVWTYLTQALTEFLIRQVGFEKLSSGQALASASTLLSIRWRLFQSYVKATTLWPTFALSNSNESWIDSSLFFFFFSCGLGACLSNGLVFSV